MHTCLSLHNAVADTKPHSQLQLFHDPGHTGHDDGGAGHAQPLDRRGRLQHQHLEPAYGWWLWAALRHGRSCHHRRHHDGSPYVHVDGGANDDEQCCHFVTHAAGYSRGLHQVPHGGGRGWVLGHRNGQRPNPRWVLRPEPGCRVRLQLALAWLRCLCSQLSSLQRRLHTTPSLKISRFNLALRDEILSRYKLSDIIHFLLYILRVRVMLIFIMYYKSP